MGYAKRLTFESESKLNATNYLWSDNHPDGLGLEPRAVLKGMKFQILVGDQIIGQANVFRADMPQQEESTVKVNLNLKSFKTVILINFYCFRK